MYPQATSLGGGLPTPVLVALIALGVVQLTLQIVALVDLARRQIVAGGRKWVWVVVTVLGGLIGALAYLAVGRTAPRFGADEPQAGNEGARRRALDTLYGPERPRRD
ncbi:MAG: PLD nuclease N-terminal domain-containing protein [Gemmatimonadaceae bacterium]